MWAFIHTLHKEAQGIATDLKIHDRIEHMAEQQAYITLKDHRDNFQTRPTCRLVNPGKSEIGRISKQILDKINTTVKNKTLLNQWKNSLSVINWLTNIPNKHQHKFVIFDIDNFYPSKSENILKNAIHFAMNYCQIIEKDIDVNLHARKSLIFSNGTAWTKKDNSMFDITMGSFDGVEICELVELYILNKLCEIYGKDNIG